MTSRNSGDRAVVAGDGIVGHQEGIDRVAVGAAHQFLDRALDDLGLDASSDCG